MNDQDQDLIQCMRLLQSTTWTPDNVLAALRTYRLADRILLKMNSSNNSEYSFTDARKPMIINYHFIRSKHIIMATKAIDTFGKPIKDYSIEIPVLAFTDRQK